MFNSKLIDFKSAGSLNKLVLDYLENKTSVKPFYGSYPDKKGFAELLNANPYANFDRTKLSEILRKQSELVKNNSDSSLLNITLLKNKNTFTVTTGHQLCLFTGPLYFIYKIFSTINLAEALKQQFQEFDFVPVYWMASEDHDFEEVSSFTSNGKIVKWETEQKGAVGEFKTAELKKIMPALRQALGISENANYLYGLFENAYLKHDNLSAATFYLVNELFGKYGLVTIDGNDHEFKNQIKDIFEKDIFENIPAHLVGESVKKLETAGQRAQVNPRLINCFYLEDKMRVRIEKSDDFYTLVGTEKSFTKKEIKTIIENTPEKISPNVVLRPVYQQIILPNLAYVGGPGELSYWLEFKNMFDGLGVLFPILMPRNFVTVVDDAAKQKIDQLRFLESDFFKSESDIVNEYMIRNNHVFNMDKETEKMKEFYSNVVTRTNVIDKTLSGNVLAEMQRTLKRLNSVSAKTNKALKKNHDIELNRIKAVKHLLFPNGIPQERHENFSSLYIKYGVAFFEALKTEINPFTFAHKIIVEE